MADLIYEKFRILNKQPLGGNDARALSLLYLPLMGMDSHTLYLLLQSLLDGETYTFKTLLDMTNFKNVKAIQQAMDKLEAIGLLRVYYHENKGYAFEVVAPLSFASFFDNEFLSGLLETQIGSVEFKHLQNSGKVKLVGYKEITKKFSDVFLVSPRNIDTVKRDLFSQSLKLDNESFNYSLFKVLFDESVLSQDVLNDNEFKTRIERISLLYKLNEEEMRDVIVKTIDIDKNIEYSSISKNARQAFQNKYNSKGTRLENKSRDNYIPSVMDENYQEILNYVENASITDVLMSISGIKPSVAEIKMFESLQENTSFRPEVINLMILYVSCEKNGELPSYNYFEKIANTWARANIETARQALEFINNRSNSKTESQKVYNKKKEKKVPAWYTQYTDELQKHQEEEMTSEEKEELEKIVKDVFG